jgi:hypothetical protein
MSNTKNYLLSKYIFTNEYTAKREDISCEITHSEFTNGWVLRDKEGKYVDFSLFINVLISKNNLIVKEEINESY